MHMGRTRLQPRGRVPRAGLGNVRRRPAGTAVDRQVREESRAGPRQICEYSRGLWRQIEKRDDALVRSQRYPDIHVSLSPYSERHFGGSFCLLGCLTLHCSKRISVIYWSLTATMV